MYYDNRNKERAATTSDRPVLFKANAPESFLLSSSLLSSLSFMSFLSSLSWVSISSARFSPSSL